jgi:multidrug resistance efflux pump
VAAVGLADRAASLAGSLSDAVSRLRDGAAAAEALQAQLASAKAALEQVRAKLSSPSIAVHDGAIAEPGLLGAVLVGSRSELRVTLSR